MKHLYIIGNGFDILTGLKTRYSDFWLWLEHTYPFVFENMQEAYEMNGEWWNDFETQLGKLNVKNYVRKFTPPVPPIEELIKHIEERNATNDKKLTQQDLYGSPGANYRHKRPRCLKLCIIPIYSKLSI